MSIVPVVELSPLELVDESELVVAPPVLESALPEVVPFVSDEDDASLALLVPLLPSAGALSD